MSVDLEDITQDVPEQQFAMLYFALPMPIFKLVNQFAEKEGLGVSDLMTRALHNELKRIEAQEGEGG